MIEYAQEKLSLTRRELQEIVVLTSKLITQIGGILTSKIDHLFSSIGIKATLPSDEPILFMDVTHKTQATKLSCCWIHTGTDKPIETTSSRARSNIVGAIRLGHIEDAITRQYVTVNGESIIDFFKLIKEKYSSNKPVHLYWTVQGIIET